MKKIGNYSKYGFEHYQNFFEEKELLLIEPIVTKFHNTWLKEHSEIYKKGSINSHSLTSSNYLNQQEKNVLFNFISQQRLIELLSLEQLKFLNTQLFFDPKNTKQKNYWHRDIQYTGLDEEEQMRAIKTQNVVHFRIPLKNEQGIELIPVTHRKWDSKDEYEVRKSLNGKKPSDKLKHGKHIHLKRTDLLIFSANMIHRGIYGNERLSLDIIYCDNNPAILKFRDENNLPKKTELRNYENREIFLT
jgi:hypothetical protein